MAPKILFLGATGYIGGDALYALVQKHPEYEITCLVRDSDKGSLIAAQYAKVRLIYGTLDDSELLEKEAEKAEIVLNLANADNENAIKALTKGLATREPTNRSFYIHISGGMVTGYKTLELASYGEHFSEIYDDWDGLEKTWSIPNHAPHRSAEKAATEANSDSLKTAIVNPPLIYGQGRGPANQRSHQVPELIRCVLEKKQAFRVGPGENFMATVHVIDLSDALVRLVEAAVDGGTKATWGKDGYYFIENGGTKFGQIAKDVANATFKQGLIPSEDVNVISANDADNLISHGAALWGANFRSRALRAQKLLGWSPTQAPLDQTIDEAVKYEARKLGLTSGHAAKVAG